MSHNITDSDVKNTLNSTTAEEGHKSGNKFCSINVAKHISCENDRIRRMKTFLQRWWIINRLNALCRIKNGVVWVNEKDFIDYIKSVVTNKGKTCDHGVTFAIKWPFSYIGEIKTDLLLYSKIRNIIDECSDSIDGPRLLIREPDRADKSGQTYHLRLSSTGRERYAFSYIVFGTYYGKNTWTGAIAATVGWYIVHLLSQVK